MKIRITDRCSDIEYDIDFSRPIDYNCLGRNSFGVPVLVHNEPPDYTAFWRSSTCITVIVDGDRYTLDKDDPKEYERLVNNLEVLFALYGLG